MYDFNLLLVTSLSIVVDILTRDVVKYCYWWYWPFLAVLVKFPLIPLLFDTSFFNFMNINIR